jgi:poly-gamma-glutamate capsule biosynthesis protein CapA/YwtB (metallophosphatase superfamily)
MAFTGDILIHEQLWETAATHAAGSARFDFRPLFARVRPLIAGADLAICHLETPLSPDDRDLSSYPVFETPSEVAEAIAWAGYDGCSTASNHSLDGGASGVAATLHWLDRAGLGHAGTARSWKEARSVTAYRVKGATVAHLSYSWGFNGFTPDHDWRANRIVVARVEADVARARKAGADLVVVSVHWGAEYTRTPTPWQREVADLLTRRRDIDLVVGHHAHVVQPVHREHGTWVAYGLGNFLSGMTSSLGTSAVEDGVILVVKAKRSHRGWRVSDVSFVPTWVEYDTWRILPIARTLGRRWPSTSLRVALRASMERTITAVRLLGDGVRPTSRPRTS